MYYGMNALHMKWHAMDSRPEEMNPGVPNAAVVPPVKAPKQIPMQAPYEIILFWEGGSCCNNKGPETETDMADSKENMTTAHW